MKALLTTFNQTLTQLGNLIPEWLINLAARVGIFMVFWGSVQTKIEGWTIAGQHLKFWNVTDSTFLLFDFEYGIPLIPSEISAYMASFGEFFLSLGILFGVLTRLSAFGLLIMTAVIQIFVYPNAWPLHLLWAALLLYLIRQGGGKLSLDGVIFK